VAWPDAPDAKESASAASSRLVPEASQSIEFRILDGAKLLRTEVLARPATEVTIKELPAKKLMVQVRAFPNADASGVAQAIGQVPMEIKADETVKVAVTLQSTIERLAPSPEGTLSLEINGKVNLSATPRSAAGEVVLVKVDTLRWTSSAPNVASVNSSGAVTGVGSGEAAITVTEPESGKSVTFLFVVGPVGRLVYSQIEGNIRGDHFAQDGPGEFHEVTFNGVPPLFSYGFSGKIPPPAAEVNTRECSILLSRDIPEGTRVAVLGGAVGNPIAEMTLIETENEYDGRGDLARYRERAFQGISGHVTLVKIEGSTRTVRVENVKMRAYDRVSGGDDLGTPVSVDGTGTFVVNGTLTFKVR
jgi:hypothetical protein